MKITIQGWGDICPDTKKSADIFTSQAVWQFLPLSHSEEHSRPLRVRRWYHHRHDNHHGHHHPLFTDWRLGLNNRSTMPKITLLESEKVHNSTQTLSQCFLLYNMPYWKRLKVGGEGDDRGWDGCMASPMQWTWVWAGSRGWWWTGRPGVLQFMGSQSWTQLSNWTEPLTMVQKSFLTVQVYLRAWLDYNGESRILGIV